MIRLLSLFFVILGPLIANGQDRHALLIGNSQYGGDRTLLNPARDVDALKPALESLGFAATVVKDADQERMEDAIVDFSKLLGKGKVGFFFYAGHGLQVEGINYMVPTKANIRGEVDVKRKCVDVGYALEAMESVENSFNVVVLDCCRDNPYKRGWKRGTRKGLAAIAEIPDGTIVAFSTAPGRTADDGSGGRNSPFTASLVRALDRRPAEGLKLVDVFFDVGRDVREKTGQRPWINLDTSMGGVYLWRDNVTNSQNADSGTTPSRLKSPKTGVKQEMKDGAVAQVADDSSKPRLIPRDELPKSDKEWKAILSEEQFHVTRQKGTERAFTNKYHDCKETGIYHCVCCGSRLFSSTEKYDSGTGWPAFKKPVKESAIKKTEDRSFYAVRTALTCAHCAAHLGYFFDDGPKPDGTRYCVNSAALNLVKPQKEQGQD